MLQPKHWSGRGSSGLDRGDQAHMHSQPAPLARSGELQLYGNAELKIVLCRGLTAISQARKVPAIMPSLAHGAWDFMSRPAPFPWAGQDVAPPLLGVNQLSSPV